MGVGGGADGRDCEDFFACCLGASPSESEEPSSSQESATGFLGFDLALLGLSRDNLDRDDDTSFFWAASDMVGMGGFGASWCKRGDHYGGLYN